MQAGVGHFFSEISFRSQHETSRYKGRVQMKALRAQEIQSAKIAFHEKDFSKGIRLCGQVLQKTQDHSLVWELVAQVSIETGKLNIAAIAMQFLLKQNGPNARLLYQLAMLHMQMGNTQRAHLLLRMSDLLEDLPTQHRVFVNDNPSDVQPTSVSSDNGTMERLFQIARIAEESQDVFWTLEASLEILARMPQHRASLVVAANALQMLGRLDESHRVLTKASLLPNATADLHIHLGNLCQDLNRSEEAREQYQIGLDIEPDSIPALKNLSQLHLAAGKVIDAGAMLDRVLRLDRDPVAVLLNATMLPPLVKNLQDLESSRENVLNNLNELKATGFQLNLEHHVIPTLFYAAYHGRNDRELNELYASLISAPASPSPRGKQHPRIRIGFISSYFCNHTIGRLNLGTIRNFDREKFEVFVLSLSRSTDATQHAYRDCADTFIDLPATLPAARESIRRANLDVLFYTDLGMSAAALTLAHSRLAPLQCVTWGHPVTSGIPAIDYFISSKELETADGQEHYSETLVKLTELVCCYDRPHSVDRKSARQHFGFSDSNHVYGCPQTLFKLHPDFDLILAEITARDPIAQIVLINGKYPEWNKCIHDRLSRVIPRYEHRIRMLSPMPRDEYLQLCAASDVLLDPIHFGGGNSSYEGFALGVPIVTIPSPFLRGRITTALYNSMGLRSEPVTTVKQYVDKAVGLATNAESRLHASEQIEARSHRLFNQVHGIRELENWILEKIG